MNKYSQAIINYLKKRDYELEKRKHNFVILDVENKQIEDILKKLSELDKNSITICSLDEEPNIVNWEDNQHLYDIMYAQKTLKQEIATIDLENKK